MHTYVYNLTFTVPPHLHNGLFDQFAPFPDIFPTPPPPNGYSKAWYKAPTDWQKHLPLEPGPITQDCHAAPVSSWPMPIPGDPHAFRVAAGDHIYVRVATNDGKWSSRDVFWGLSIGIGRALQGERPALASPFELGSSAKAGERTPAALFFIPSIPGLSGPLSDGSWLYYLGKVRSGPSHGQYGFIVCLAAGDSKGVYNWGNDPQMDVTG